MSSILDIGLDRKRGLQGGFRSPSPREHQDMVPDILPPAVPSFASHNLHHQQNSNASTTRTSPSKLTITSTNNHDKNNNNNKDNNNNIGQHYFTVASSNNNNNNNSSQQHWDNSSRGIETHKRRSPIMTSKKSVIVTNNQTMGDSEETKEAEEIVDPTGGDISFTIMLSNDHVTSHNISHQNPNSHSSQPHHHHQHHHQSNVANNSFVDSTPTKQLLTTAQPNNHAPSPNSGANTPSWVKKQLQELQLSPHFNQHNNNNNSSSSNKAIGIGSNNYSLKKRRNSASIGTVNRQTVQIIPGPSNNHNTNSNNNNNNNLFSPSPLDFGMNNNNQSGSFVKLSPVHFSAASHFGNKKGAGGFLGSYLGQHNNNNNNNHNKHASSNLSMMNISASSTPGNTPNNNNNNNNNSHLYSSPVVPSASDPVNFYFITKQKDPIKEQLRRADAVIAALPSKDATPLPPVVDITGNPMSSASVLDGLVNRTTLLQLEHDRTVQNQKQQQQQQQPQQSNTAKNAGTSSAFASTTTEQKHHQQKNKDRTANAIMGIHISALLDLSRSLALTDPNASQVVRRVHEVLTSHVVKSVEEPLERVSSLYDQARRHAEQAWDESATLKSQLLDAQAEIQALKRQVRKRDDMLAYLTSAYSLPTVFKDTTSDNPELVSQALMVEASPSAAVAKKNAEARNRRGSGDGASLDGAGGGRRRSLSGDRSGSISGVAVGGTGAAAAVARRNSPGPGRNGDDEMNSWYDPNKTLQEQFQVIIPSQQEKEKILSAKNKAM